MEEEEKQKILAEVKLKYPVGCKIRSPQSGNDWIIDNDKFIIGNSGSVRIHVQNQRYEPWLKWEGKWAEVLELPEPKINNNYSIY